MQISITRRLTLTCAVLTAVILVPATVSLHLAIEGRIEHEKIQAARSQASHIAETLLHQLDEDLLVDFGGQGEVFKDVRLTFRDWAVVRRHGKTVHVSGLFRDQLEPLVADSSSLLRSRSGGVYRVTSAPLMEGPPLRLEDLPPSIRAAAAPTTPEDVFLRAKREVSAGKDVVEVKVLQANRVLETKFTEAGTIFSRKFESLPGALPPDVLSEITQEMGEAALDPLQWTAYDGQLIAVVSGRAAGGAAFKVAVNRLGERFALADDGRVEGPLQEWRLRVITANDAEGELVATRELLLGLYVGGPLIWMAMVICGWYVARKAMAPVQGIVDAVQRIELYRLNDRLPLKSVEDELSRITVTINNMLDRIERGYLRERQFTEDASHELRSPLAKVRAEADLSLLQPRTPEEYQSALKRCRGYAEGMQRLVESLLFLARLDGKTDRVDWKPFDIVDLALEKINGLASQDSKRVGLELGESESPFLAIGDRSLIGILLQNLIENALRYSSAEKPIVIKITAKGQSVVVQVVDEGPGIPEGMQEMVFDRFCRVENSRSRATGGLGLGLSIARAIAQAHSTVVELRRGAVSGTVASFSLPASRGSVAVEVDGSA